MPRRARGTKPILGDRTPRSEFLRGQGVDQVEVVLFADFPVVLGHVLPAAGAEGVPQVLAADQLQHGVCQGLDVSGREEAENLAIRQVSLT